jgi:surface antigen
MAGRATSYTGDGAGGQSRSAARIAALLVLALSLGGCASMGLPFAEGRGDRMAAAQGRTAGRATLANVNVVDRVDPSDWETIRRTIAASSETTTERLDWLNPDTGSRGTVAVLPAMTKSGALCRSFATTISDARGVRRYGGDACLRTDGRWQLTAITADDVLIS